MDNYKINNCSCGSNNACIVSEKRVNGGHGIQCMECGNRTPMYQYVEDAIDTWNSWMKESVKKCYYCKSIDKATKSSPRKRYNYCPVCGVRRNI